MVLDLLRRPPPGFIDREPERDRLWEAVNEASAARRQAVLVVTGMPGVGKTMFAVRMAEELLGQTGRAFDVVIKLAVGERGHARTAEEVLAMCLSALKVEKIPVALAEMQALFRAKTACGATLLLLDDVEDAEQVEALLPGSADSIVIATSRRRTDGFDYYRHVILPIDVFDADYARELLVSGMDPELVRANEVSLAELVKLCGRLPFGLDIARARLRGHYRNNVGEYVRQLNVTRSRLTEFKLDGKDVLTALFEEAFHRLPAPVRLLYSLLGLHRGLQFSEQVAIRLAGPDYPGSVPEGLRLLVDWSLLAELPGGRFEIHALTAEHAYGTTSVMHAAEIERANRRMLEWYLDFTVAREQVFSDRVRFGPRFREGPAPAYSGEDAYGRANADLEFERANLRRAIGLAWDLRFCDLAWQLCEAMITFYFQRDRFDEAIEAHGNGLEAAEWLAEPVPLAVMHNALGRAFFGKRMHVEALEQFREARRQAARLSEGVALFVLAQAAIWEAFVHQRDGDNEAAVHSWSAARILVADPDFPAEWQERETRLLNVNGSIMLAAVGRHAEAIEAARNAVNGFTGSKEKHNDIKALANLGRVLAVSGDEYADEAIDVLTSAVSLEAEHELKSWEIDSCQVLGDLLLRLASANHGNGA
ncbi:NB-ARC domain-containing protein [Nocardia sp. CA-128927]|uniref:NB-ARC domain-containing protein n=1 Tax=Nocardia sp. CA-128927 TaxID=3239975 RepID=UPI003D98C8CF